MRLSLTLVMNPKRWVWFIPIDSMIDREILSSEIAGQMVTPEMKSPKETMNSINLALLSVIMGF